jgi:hypothetical protein
MNADERRFGTGIFTGGSGAAFARLRLAKGADGEKVYANYTN